MHRILLALMVGSLLFAREQSKKPQTLKEILLEQLHTTHDQKDWFVPIAVAVEGLTPEQAKWTDGHGNHSIGQLVNHLAFWNGRALEQFKGEKSKAYNGNNDETFNSFDSKTWTATVNGLDGIMKTWERAVEEADDSKLKASASEIAHIGAHNAYHLGQIIYIRRLQGSWNPDKGVK
ncbi:MAG TPA: DinB family protein [Bryobacteraceae bacterium]|nr:DinB family protein [Bryobacteraceae bacterium]